MPTEEDPRVAIVLSALDAAIELIDEYEAQWGSDYLSEKWGLPEQAAKIREDRKALASAPSREPAADEVERVAAAIFNAEELDDEAWEREIVPGDREDTRERLITMARAAISALGQREEGRGGNGRVAFLAKLLETFVTFRLDGDARGETKEARSAARELVSLLEGQK